MSASRRHAFAHALSFLLSIVVVTAGHRPAHADPRLKHAANGAVLRWPATKRVLHVCLDAPAQSVPGIDRAFEVAFEVWATVPGLHRFEIGTLDCDVFVAYRAFGWDHEPAPLAINTLEHRDDGSVVRANITINPVYKSLLGDARNNTNTYDLASVLAHELGHALGLEEDYEDKHSVMFETCFLGTLYKRTAKPGDVRAMKRLYGLP